MTLLRKRTQVLDPTAARAAEEHEAELSPRQWEILKLIDAGLTNGQIAERLEMTLDGAKWHVSEIITKLSLSSRQEAAAYWHWRCRPMRRVARFARALLPLTALKVAGGTAVVMVVGGVAAAVIAAVALSGGVDSERLSATETSSWAIAVDPGSVVTSPSIYANWAFFASVAMNLPEWDQNGGEIGERTLYAVDLFTGEDVWTRSMGEGLISKPGVADGVVYVVTGAVSLTAPDEDAPSMLHAVDAFSGDDLWTLSIEGEVTDSSALAGGLLLLEVSPLDGSAPALVVAIDTDTRSVAWTFATGSIYTPLEVAGNHVYFGLEAQPSTAEQGREHGDQASASDEGRSAATILSIDLATGEEAWSYTTHEGNPSYLVISEDQVLFATGWDDHDRGWVYALDRQTGAEQWVSQVGGSGTVAVLDGVVYLSYPAFDRPCPTGCSESSRVAGAVLSFDATTGAPLAQLALPEAPLFIVAAGEQLYAVAGDALWSVIGAPDPGTARIYALAPTTGAHTLVTETAAISHLPFEAAGSTLYIADVAGGLQAIR